MSIRLRVIHVDRVPQLSQKLGLLATVEVTNGSVRALSNGEFADLAAPKSRWLLTSVGLCDPPSDTTAAVAFKKVSGETDLSPGMELQQV